MCKTFGYCRISTAKQSIDRQVRNILASYPDADIRKEVFTGTHYQGRDELQKILNRIQSGDTIVFDSVSRMSRNADEGIKLYFDLFNRGVNLVFLKENYINTDTYKSALKNQVDMTGGDVDLILQGVNEYLIRLAKKQIRIAFEQAQKEVDDLHQRTREGIETARLNGKLVGGTANKGKEYNVKKAASAIDIIKKHSKTFGGNLSNKELQKLCGISEPTLLKYKKQIKMQMRAEELHAYYPVLSEDQIVERLKKKEL